MMKGDAVAPFEIEKKLRARYALLGVHNIVLFAMSAIDMCGLGRARPGARPAAGAAAGRRRRGRSRAYNSNGLGIMALKALDEGSGASWSTEGFSAVKLRLGRPDARRRTSRRCAR